METGRQTTELFKSSSRSQIHKGDWFTPEHGERDRRLRVIFDNGTESDLLMRSLRRALNKDEHSRRIVPPQPELEDDFSDIGPLFSSEIEEGDCASGAIYVARSLSDNSFVQENCEILHKIGLTTGDPEKRAAGAKKETTYLFAAVELVAVYRLANINCKAFESFGGIDTLAIRYEVIACTIMKCVAPLSVPIVSVLQPVVSMGLPSYGMLRMDSR